MWRRGDVLLVGLAAGAFLFLVVGFYPNFAIMSGKFTKFGK